MYTYMLPIYLTGIINFFYTYLRYFNLKVEIFCQLGYFQGKWKKHTYPLRVKVR